MKKKQRYGGRWEIVPGSRFGSGGQAEVFRVRDLTGALSGDYALKRVLNIDRRARFIREVQAVKTLNHPNIIPLVDHSLLDEQANGEEKQYLVMPIAHGGDLGQAGILKRYENSIDGVITIAKQLSSALATAHLQGIIHRDVKPKNILLTGNGHDVWLADFGICLIRAHDRLTDTRELMGPAFFMAPELESGARLDVTPAADVYSLGKTIFFMFSGGALLPRERLDEELFASIFKGGGERQNLLLTLLRRMICPIDRRISSMEDVLKGLQSIEAWESTALLLPINLNTREKIRRLQENAERKLSLAARDKAVKDFENERFLMVQAGVDGWLKSELEKVRVEIESSGVFDSRVDGSLESTRGAKLPADNGKAYFRAGGAIFSYAPKGGSSRDAFSFVVLLCNEGLGMFELYEAEEEQARDASGVLIPNDEVFCLIPFFYRGVYSGGLDKLVFPLKNDDGPEQEEHNSNIVFGYQTSAKFENGKNQKFRFKASEWPSNQRECGNAVRQFLEAFFSFVEQSE